MLVELKEIVELWDVNNNNYYNVKACFHYIFFFVFTNFKSLVRLFKANIYWFLEILWFEKIDLPPRKTSDKENASNLGSISSDLSN